MVVAVKHYYVGGTRNVKIMSTVEEVKGIFKCVLLETIFAPPPFSTFIPIVFRMESLLVAQ